MARKRRVGSTSPSCTRCCMTVMYVSAVSPKWLRPWGSVGAPVRKLSRKRTQTNHSHVPNFSENPMGMQLPSRSHENIWDEDTHARPQTRLVSNNASFFSHLFIYPLIYREYDLFFLLQLFLLGAGKGRWRKNIKLYVRMLSLGYLPIWSYSIAGNRNSLCLI